MEIIEEYINNININDELSIALGTFDGIHRGHHKIIEQAVELSKKLNIKSAVMTFDIHPTKILKPESHIKIITNNRVKAEIIEAMGVDYLFFIKFNREFANMNELEFLSVLKNKFNCRAVVCGYNYTFGKYGEGNTTTLNNYKNELQYTLNIIGKVKYKAHIISSSMIRGKVESGNIKEANELLGYNYFIKGKVLRCKQLGRKLGFPTANIEIDDDICLKNGVYITITCFEGKKYASISSVGKNPTIGDKKRMVEAHLLDFEEDLYDKEIKVEFLEFVRGEMKFKSVEELKNRVHEDINNAKVYFSSINIYNI